MFTQQETATQEQSLSKTRESQLVDNIKLLEEAKSDLEAEVEQLEKQMKQLEILSSDTEQLTKVHICIASTSCVHVVLFPVCEVSHGAWLIWCERVVIES